jgi:uncharacterized protein YjiS (DUF1127 family)
MSTRSYANHRPDRRISVPFAEFVAPMSHIGEAVYTAIEGTAGLVGQAFRTAKVKARARKQVNVLSGLDDRTLKDIGVRRSEIRYVARKVAENPGLDYRVICR